MLKQLFSQKQTLRKAEAFSMPKLLLVLVFAVVGGVYIFNDFGSSFNKQDTSKMITDLNSMNTEGAKNVQMNRAVSIDDYSSKLKNLAIGELGPDSVVLTDAGEAIFTGGDETGAVNDTGDNTDVVPFSGQFNTDGTSDTVVMNIITNKSLTDPIGDDSTGSGDNDNIRVPEAITPAEVDSSAEAGFEWDTVYLVGDADKGTLMEKVKQDAPANYEYVGSVTVDNNGDGVYTDETTGNAEALQVKF